MSPSLALDDVRVLDLTRVMAGPFCTMLLADMGADVVKIEMPGEGDLSRQMDPLIEGTGESGAFLAVNRNKRSVSLNLKTEAGRRIFEELIGRSDVLVENFRPGVMSRLGLDYETVSKRHPGIIYCSISGFGTTGPYKDRAGLDLIAQGMTGLMSVTGHPGSEPVKCGIPVTDLGAALFATYGILAALHEKGKTGLGQLVDTSLFEAGLGLAVWETTEYFVTNRVPQPTGSAHRLSAPYQAYRTKDGYITVGADSERHWPVFCELLGLSELTDDPRFATNGARLRHLEQLTSIIEEKTKARTTDELVVELLAEGIPVGPLKTIPEVLADEHTTARSMVQEIKHPKVGKVGALGPVVKLSRTPAQIYRPPPMLGEQTEEVLKELGFEQGEIDELREGGAFE